MGVPEDQQHTLASAGYLSPYTGSVALDFCAFRPCLENLEVDSMATQAALDTLWDARRQLHSEGSAYDSMEGRSL